MEANLCGFFIFSLSLERVWRVFFDFLLFFFTFYQIYIGSVGHCFRFPSLEPHSSGSSSGWRSEPGQLRQRVGWGIERIIRCLMKWSQTWRASSQGLVSVVSRFVSHSVEKLSFGEHLYGGESFTLIGCKCIMMSSSVKKEYRYFF